MKTIIIEDENPSARRLKRMLEKLNVEVVATLSSVQEAIDWFQKNENPELIFLDIQLSDGLSFEIFENLEIHSAVIFTTAYDEYALQAFKLNSIDYLLKPIDDEELKTAVEKYKKHSRPSRSLSGQIDFEEIKRMLVNPLEREYKKRFTVKVGQHIKMIPLEEIECIYSENKGSYIYTTAKRNYLLECTLDALEKDLPPEQFYRVNRKYYIKLSAIADIIAYSNSRLKVKLHHFDEEEIIVARERVKGFKEWLG
ncbi:MAG TPA: LytTR family DNA-binding domain-containing protein [Salinimicrobium sp.]|nr:LytTR family DNA-binding domain-containing protein [Salinimicrobium sp.]